MKNMKKKVSAVVLTTMFAMMQVSAALDTGLGVGNGGAVINNVNGGFAGLEKGTNSATLKFDGNTHVNWNTLNVNANESLNFNAVNNANGLTVLNTVTNGMTKIYGQINANEGISKLIISNPNGVLFDGAKFSTAGDTLITTQALTMGAVNGNLELQSLGQPVTAAITVQNSDFSVGGDLSFAGSTIEAVASALKGNNVRFTTVNGQDYVVEAGVKTAKTALKLDALNIDGDVYIVTNKGDAKIVNGGTINGNLNAEFGSNARVNEEANGNRLTVTKDVTLSGHGQHLMLRHTDVKGNVKMTNDGGYVDFGNNTVNGNVDLVTNNFDPIRDKKYNHYVHVVGNNTIDGNLNIDSAQNIHIGGYQIDPENPKNFIDDTHFFYNGKVMPGSLTVKGDLNAKTSGGHIMTTVNTTAKNIKYEAKSESDDTRTYGGNILSDGKAVLKAETYEFKSDGYIGGIKETATMSQDNRIINFMETYTPIPADLVDNEYLVVDGGTITKLETPKVSPEGNDVQVRIKSNNDLTLTGANAGDINLTAPKSKITITGDVHAKEINVGPETDYLKLDFEGRDFTTNYTNIRDKKVITIKPDDVITYEMTDGKGGNNQPTLKPDDNTTYLIGPDPVIPPEPTPDPVNPPKDDNVRVKNWVPDDPMKAPISTPVAFAADLDDDEEDAGVRKNVDGSVTVVRAFPMMGT